VKLLGAVLTGGASRRMGGRPKGLLPGPDGAPLALRAVRIFHTIGVPCVLVGNREIYGGLGVEVIDDTRPGEGPLAGLEAALREAARRGAEGALLVACDMPFFTAELLARLARAPAAAAVAPWREGRHEPLFARYRGDVLAEVQARLERGERGMQPLLRALGAAPLALEVREEALLADWDTPEEAGGLSGV
jgi:molybdopterin-guanine dinucleotide biosynthesis protein A